MAIAVVGGGLAGLSAALALKDSSQEVVLFERSRLLGGKATSFEVDGVEVDNGQHVYLACCTEFVDFVKRAMDGAGDRCGPTHGRGGDSVLFLQDRFEALLLARDRPVARLRAARLPAPLHLAPSLLRYKHLSLKDRLGIARAMLAASRPPRDGETFANWLARHGQGAEARAAFWDPFLVPALNAPLEAVGAIDALFTIRTAFLHDAGAARFGYSTVPLVRIAEAAAKQLDKVHLRTAVTGIEPQVADDAARDRLPRIVVKDREPMCFEGVVLAVPPERLARILGKSEGLGVTGLDAFQTAPIVDVHLWYDVTTLGFDFAALLDSPIQWVFEKGPGYVCCSMSAADAHAGRSNAALVELCHRELTALVPALSGARLLRGSATRDRDATFVPSPGLRRPGPLTADPRVVIAGAWTDTGWPATMESAVRSGRAAARALLAQMSGRA